MDQVDGVLGALARTDQTVATALATAKPTDDTGSAPVPAPAKTA
jgi:hypothetical protein